MHRDVDISGIGRESLAHHEAGLAMGIASAAEPLYPRLQRKIPRYSPPDEMKRIVGEPHILSAASNQIGAGGRVENNGAGVAGFADVALLLERSQILSVDAGQRMEQQSDQEQGR